MVILWSEGLCKRKTPVISTGIEPATLRVISQSLNQRHHRVPHLNIQHGFHFLTVPMCGPGSSVGIATDYGLDCPGSNPGGDEIFCPSRPALEPTQPPVKQVPVLSRG